MDRLSELTRFYEIIGDLETRLGPKRRLSECGGRMPWPKRGVYFFFESGETRSNSGGGPRVVRVGTHALSANSRATLWGRLYQHRGIVKTGGGNHRGSIFRLLVGIAIRNRDRFKEPVSWGVAADLGKAAQKLGMSRADLLREEHTLERQVSDYIGNMPFLWLPIEGPPGPSSERGFVERNSIALLSNFGRTALDPASDNWLGRFCDREPVQRSGLWNNDYVANYPEAGFLDRFRQITDEAMNSHEK